jgi:hypothetical protein
MIGGQLFLGERLYHRRHQQMPDICLTVRLGRMPLTEWSLVESVSFLPMSLLIQSFCWLFPPPVDVIPGTTRGMVKGDDQAQSGKMGVNRSLI